MNRPIHNDYCHTLLEKIKRCQLETTYKNEGVL
jgi:hypothetical protein